MSLSDKYVLAVRKICSQHGVKKLYVFGSVLNDKFNTDSDIDFIVDFEPLDIDRYADNFFSLKAALEDALDRKIDLLEEQAIRNPYFKQVVESQRQLVYGH